MHTYTLWYSNHSLVPPFPCTTPPFPCTTPHHSPVQHHRDGKLREALADANAAAARLVKNPANDAPAGLFLAAASGSGLTGGAALSSSNKVCFEVLCTLLCMSCFSGVSLYISCSLCFPCAFPVLSLCFPGAFPVLSLCFFCTCVIVQVHDGPCQHQVYSPSLFAPLYIHPCGSFPVHSPLYIHPCTFTHVHSPLYIHPCMISPQSSTSGMVPMWTCTACTTANKMTLTECSGCGNERAQSNNRNKVRVVCWVECGVGCVQTGNKRKQRLVHIHMCVFITFPSFPPFSLNPLLGV